jgi:hypothetical protein
VRPSFDAVIDEVLRAFGESPETLRAWSRRPARKALAQLASEDAGLTFAAIGAYANVTGEAASYLAREGRCLADQNPEYRRRIAAIRSSLGVASRDHSVGEADSPFGSEANG